MELYVWLLYGRQLTDVAPTTVTPDVTNHAAPRRSKRHRHHQASSSTEPATPDVAVTSPVSAIERLDNLIKVMDTFIDHERGVADRIYHH